MCGVAANCAYHCASAPADVAELAAMSARLASRGPDDAGSWNGGEGRVTLGHRRLAIIDLDQRAAQPMVSACGRFVISFNGEIYNYRELRDELIARGAALRTTSDTEALLELYARDGEAALCRLRGMFAFALWDVHERALLLVRDPYGIKPLYYADDGWTVRAASQVKALLAGGAVSRDPEPAGIVGFLLFGAVPEPFTCHQEVRAVPAGATVRVDALGAHAPVPYASIATVLREAEEAAAGGGVKDPREDIRTALLDSVRHHLVADEPVGLFLSAGIDSAVLLALMAELRDGAGADDPIRAVTLAFTEFRGRHDDEAPLAADLALRFGAEHTVRVVDRAEFTADLPRILDAMDQPTIDGLNTWFVSKAARERGLKVALSGLGGDELFGGYPSFRDLPRWLRALRWPSRLPLAGRAARAVVGRIGAARGWHPKLAGVVELGGAWPGAYLLRRGLFMPWELETILDPEIARAGLRRLRWDAHIALLLEDGPTTTPARVALLESALYMRHQLLRDTDWSSMAHSLEVRVPLVDVTLLRRVAPLSFAGKELLAASPACALPETVVHRVKTGFTTPIEAWMGRLPGAGNEPWARRWARTVAHSMLPEGTLRDPPPTALVGPPALRELA